MSAAAPDAAPFDITRILSRLPHRYPLLLVDRVTECEPGKTIKAYKNVTFNEPFFQGHFPGLPVMPGVLIVEALAQASTIMVTCSLPQEEVDSYVYLFAGIENVRFRQQVVPGDRLDFECALLRNKRNIWKISGQAFVDGKLAAHAEMTAAMVARSVV